MNKVSRKSLITPVILASIAGFSPTSVQAGGFAFSEDLWFSAEFFRPQVTGRHRSTFWAWDSRPASAFNGTMALGYRPAGSPWSIDLKYNRERSKTTRHNESSSTGRPYRAYEASRETHDVLDFEVGRDVGLGQRLSKTAKARVKLGIRFARFSATSRFTGHYTSYGVWLTPYDFDRKSRFRGVGPSFGLEASFKLGNNWSLGIDGSAAALYGQQVYKTNFWGKTSTRKKTLAFNFTGSVGVSYKLPDSPVIFTAGYKADSWLNAIRAEKSPGQEAAINRLYHGPFLRVTIGGS